MGISGHIADRHAALHKEAQHWLLHLTSGMATSHDARAFEHWCGQSAAHVEAFAETRRLWENLGPAAQAWMANEQIRATTKSSLAASLPRMQPRMSRRAFLGAAVAASAALVVVHPPLQLWPSLSDMAADYRTATGEQREVDLGRGVVVQMNTQTAMNLRRSESQAIDIDLLGGEIQVKATAGDSVRVFAGGGSIDVGAMGKCNVRCDEGGVQVTGLDGAVTLRYQGQTTVLRTAQRTDYRDGQVGQVLAADVETTMGWRRRVLIFDGQPLVEVVREINRYRPGKIILANDTLSARKVQARFSLNQLADVAALIKDAYGANVTALPGGIVILS